MGDVAAELLLELIAGGEPRTVVLPTEFAATRELGATAAAMTDEAGTGSADSRRQK